MTRLEDELSGLATREDKTNFAESAWLRLVGQDHFRQGRVGCSSAFQRNPLLQEFAIAASYALALPCGAPLAPVLAPLARAAEPSETTCLSAEGGLEFHPRR